MRRPHDGNSSRWAAGPVMGDGGALRARASSTPPSPMPPAEEAGNAQASDVGAASPAPPAGEAEDASQVQTDLDALIADTQRERDEYLDLAKRTKADFENFRKRMAADVQAASIRGKASVAEALIDAAENLERALASEGIDPETAELEDGFAHGVLLVYKGMRETLSRTGIESIDPVGEKFDPQLHEALQKIPVEGAEAGMVVETMQKGIVVDEQLIRPARVVVSE
jgi:molecular chaperone GrpE